jgi:hypothetical protein
MATQNIDDMQRASEIMPSARRRLGNVFRIRLEVRELEITADLVEPDLDGSEPDVVRQAPDSMIRSRI